jgi:hypothetical protein
VYKNCLDLAIEPPSVTEKEELMSMDKYLVAVDRDFDDLSFCGKRGLPCYVHRENQILLNV